MTAPAIDYTKFELPFLPKAGAENDSKDDDDDELTLKSPNEIDSIYDKSFEPFITVSRQFAINNTAIIDKYNYLFDDSTIQKMEPSSIINSKNYCLFYRKIK